MNRLARKALTVAAIAAGLLAVPAAAQAAPAHCGGGDVYQSSSGNYGLLNGTQIAVPIDLGLDLSHNALGILGAAGSYGDDNVYCGGHHHRHHRHHHHGFGA